MNTFTKRYPLPTVAFIFAGFTWPRYVAEMPRGGSSLAARLARRIGSCCGPYYHAPRPIAESLMGDQGKGFYLQSDGAPDLRWQWADDVEGIGRAIDHSGWFTDEHGYGDKIRGVVFRLARQRGFLAGWSMGEGMASNLDCRIYDTEIDAAFVADSMAENAANTEIEYEAEERARIEAEEYEQDSSL